MPNRVLMRDEGGVAKKVVAPWASETLYSVLGWIGVVMAAAALVDYAIALLPTHFSSMEWEVGTISQVFAGLPLLSLGLAAIWVSGAGVGRRWQLLAIGLAFEVGALIVLVLLLAFALDVPVAIKGTPVAARSPVVKLVLKTVIMGLLFGAAYIIAGVLALKQARGTSSGETVS